MDSNLKDLLTQLVKLTAANAKATASLLNEGSALGAVSSEPGSSSRANELRGLANEVEEAFHSYLQLDN